MTVKLENKDGIVRLTHDHKEAVQAFKDKRPPKFLGK